MKTILEFRRGERIPTQQKPVWLKDSTVRITVDEKYSTSLVLLVWCRPWVHKTRQFNVHQNCFVNSLFLANNYHRGLSQVFQSNVNVGPVQELQWIFCQKHGYCAAVWWQIWLPNVPDFRRQFTNSFFTLTTFFNLFIFFFLTLESSTRRGTSSALATWILSFRDPAECSRKCHRSIRRHRRPNVPHLGEPFLFKGLRFIFYGAHKSVSDAAESTCCRARRPRAHGGLADANAIVSLWTDGWHNRCVNMTSIQPVLCVWLA